MADPAVQDEGGALAPPSLSTDPGVQLARYTLYIPLRDAAGKNAPHVLAQVREALSAVGLHGRTVVPLAWGDWQGDGNTPYDSQELALVNIDAPDTPEVFEAVKQAAQVGKTLAGHSALHLTIQPLRSYLL